MGKWALQCKYVNVVLYWSPFMTHRIIIHWIKMTPRSSSMPHLQFENQAQRSVWEDLHQLNITVRRSKYAPFLLNVHAWNYLGTICTTGILLSKADLFAWMPYWSWWSCSSFFYSTLLCLISLLSGWLNIDDHNLFCPQEETIWQIKITQVQRISRSKSKINLILYLYFIFSHRTDLHIWPCKCQEHHTISKLLQIFAVVATPSIAVEQRGKISGGKTNPLGQKSEQAWKKL